MDALEYKKIDRQRERELWLMLIGALLAGNKGINADVLASVDISDANGEELVALLASIKSENRNHVTDCLARFGVTGEVNGKTAIQRITATVKELVAKRACIRSAQALNMAQSLATPEMYVETLERELALIKSKMN